jgi:hypothetical protein
MELTYTQWLALEQQAHQYFPYLAALCGLWFIGSLLYGFINDKEGV